MKVLDIEDFKKDCINKKCNRSTLYNEKTCLTENKQNKCFEKYIISLEKRQQKYINKILLDQKKFEDAMENGFLNDIDVEWEEIKIKVWKRDTNYDYDGIYKRKDTIKYCAIWNHILTKAEQYYIMKHFFKELTECNTLSNMHIESRQRKPELKYDIDNVLLVSDYFHDLYDNYKSLTTRDNTNNEEREKWALRFKKYIEELKNENK